MVMSPQAKLGRQRNDAKEEGLRVDGMRMMGEVRVKKGAKGLESGEEEGLARERNGPRRAGSLQSRVYICSRFDALCNSMLSRYLGIMP